MKFNSVELGYDNGYEECCMSVASRRGRGIFQGDYTYDVAKKNRGISQ
jgi:hypothetical protein